MGRLRVAALWLVAAGCARCGRPAPRSAASVVSEARDAGAPLEQAARRLPPDAGPPAPYVRNVKKLPPLPRQARVEQIFIGDNLSRALWNPPRARKRSRDEARALAEKVAGEIRRGADFNDLAKRESDWPIAARNGGMLGIVTEGEAGLLPIVDPAIFSMPVGQVSEPFESPIGFHVLKKLPMLRLAHILIATRDGKNGIPARTLGEARVLASRVEEAVKGGQSFEAEAFDWSDDLTSAGRGGDLGGVDERTGLPPALRSAAEALQPGQVSAPIEVPRGLEILKRLE